MASWQSFLQPGSHVSVTIPGLGTDYVYGYARILSAPHGDDVLVRLYTETVPHGDEGTVPTSLLLVPLSVDQFRAARKCGWPGAPDKGRALCNQTTNQIGRA
jgi:hypothetical protein